MKKDKVFKRSLLGIDAAYFAAIAILSYFGFIPELPTGGFALASVLGLATFRMARALSFNLVTEPIREFLGVFPEPDSSGAGDNNHVRGSGIRRALGELVACPICSGQWSALILVASLAAPGFGKVAIYAFAAAGFSELVHWFAEWAEWNGRLARERAGQYNRWNEQEAHILSQMSHKEDDELFSKRIEWATKRGDSNGRS